MARFFKHGNWNYSLDDVTAWAARDDGTVTVEFTRRTPVVLEGDDAAEFLSAVGGKLARPEPAPAPLVTKTAKHKE